jgi:hypothetical protein
MMSTTVAIRQYPNRLSLPIVVIIKGHTRATVRFRNLDRWFIAKKALQHTHFFCVGADE